MGPSPPEKQQRRGKSKQSKRLVLNSSQRLLPHFKETPRTTTATLLAGALENVNPHGKGCCPWHVSLKNCRSVVHDLITNGDCMDFKPLDGWQCHFCWAMNDEMDEDDGEVGVLGMQHGPRQAGTRGRRERQHCRFC